MAIGGHHNPVMLSDEWLTPPEIIESLGTFDLDPCSPIDRPWNTAKEHYTIKENGLWKQWFGRVWLNPPYGRSTSRWLSKMVAHNNGIALLFARTETRMFFEFVWNHATSVLFIEGRLHFYYPDGSRSKTNSGGPSVLIAYGKGNDKALESCDIKGKYLKLNL